ncbi:response regulator [Hydrogenimonas sp.]
MSEPRRDISILVVEDESIVALEIESYLESKGFTIVGVVDTYDGAIEILETAKVDVLLCDIYINGEKSGIDLAREIQNSYDIQVIYLTAYADEKTLGSAIDTEPLSYLTKPFKREELFAAVELAGRKRRTSKDLGDGYVYDPEGKHLRFRGEEVPLGKKEHLLLQLLIERNGKVLSFEQMEYSIWPNRCVSDSTRRTLVHRLNSKLDKQLVLTIPGVGYRLSK